MPTALGLHRRSLKPAGGPPPPPALHLVGHFDASQLTYPDGTVIGVGTANPWTNEVTPGTNDLPTGVLGFTGPTFYKTTAAKLINGLPAVWVSKAANHCGIWTSNFTFGPGSGYPAADGSYSVYVVGHGDGDASTQQDIASSDNDAASRFFRIQLSNTQSRFLVFNSAATIFEIDGPAASTSQVTVFGFTIDGTGLQAQAFMNGVSVGTVALTGPMPHTNGPFGLGDVADVGNNPLNGPVCEGLLYQVAHPAATAIAISQSLMAKWL